MSSESARSAERSGRGETEQAGRTEARRPADGRRFVGPGGAVFVPHPLIDEESIRAQVDAGEWTPVEETAKKPAAKKSAQK